MNANSDWRGNSYGGGSGNYDGRGDYRGNYYGNSSGNSNRNGYNRGGYGGNPYQGGNPYVGGNPWGYAPQQPPMQAPAPAAPAQ